MNLITDPWLPVRTTDGARIIRPDQIAEPGVLWPDWPRADLDVACLELLIGLVFLADPPADTREWRERRRPDSGRLRDRLAPLAPAFELGGEGPRFLQDLEPLAGEPNPPDMLFIDSAGGNTVRNNADLMVRRDRYPSLALPLAAMALYAFQAFAPSGGAGNRTSMRGGGPLVTLVDPAGRRGGGPLWDLVWANVPDGRAAGPEVLPWMRPTRTSAKDEKVLPSDAHPAEAFFGMPRRLRLVIEGGRVIGVVQRPWGTSYAGWRHPLTPYYRVKAGAEPLPQHPRPGAFGYRNWLGTLFVRGDGLKERAAALGTWAERRPDDRGASVIVAGWAMDNMKPRDFVLSRQPFLSLPGPELQTLAGLIEAAEEARGALRFALIPLLAEGSALDAQVETFFHRTQPLLDACLAALEQGREDETVVRDWLDGLRRTALALFDEFALPGLDRRKPEKAERIVEARSFLLGTFAGRTKAGVALYGKLGLTPPPKAKKAENA